MEWPSHVYQWHREGFSVPGGSVLLAGGENFNNQAFNYGFAFGVQFHPEITHWIMNRVGDALRLSLCHARRQRPGHRTGAAIFCTAPGSANGLTALP